jgi:hypothetical protein
VTSNASTVGAKKPLRTRIAGRISHEVQHRGPGRVPELASWLTYSARLVATRRPRTFTEKIHYKMLRDRRALLTTWADKVAVRDYVATAAGPELLAELYAVDVDLGAIDRAQLPRNFVVKVNHACGGVVIVSDRLPADAALPAAMDVSTYFLAHPDALDWDRLVQAVRHWLAQPYGGGQYREWAYHEIEPKVLVEELLETATSPVPTDYKFFVFGGVTRIVQVDTDRHGDHRQDHFDTDWNRLPVRLAAPPADVRPARPARLAEMIAVAERLAGDTDFVRVDLYEVDGRVVFGEMTSYPLAGLVCFQPRAFESLVGSWWDAPRRYR